MKTPVFITLTTRRMVLSRGNVAKLRRWFTRLRHRAVWSGVTGGIYQIELGTIDELGMCNLHIHTIADGNYIPQAVLSGVWRKITGSYVVYIERCDGDSALRYLTVHMGKVIATPVYRDIVNTALQNTRLIQQYGIIELPPPQEGETPVIPSPVCPFCGAVGGVVTQYEPLWGDCIDEGGGYG